MNFPELQQQAFKLIWSADSTVASYLNFYKSFSGLLHQDIPDYFRKPKLAFLSNFTVQGLAEVTKVRGIADNLWAGIYTSPYNQYAQEIINPASQFHVFNPDIVYFIVDLPDPSDAASSIEILDQLLAKSRAKVVIFAKEIADHYRENPQVIFFDFLDWLKKSGHQKSWYSKYMELGDLRLAPVAFPDLAEELLGYAVAISGSTKKCVAVDLDNTLWSGILGEDGLEKIVPNQDLQKFLLSLYEKGIILAINSRNNLKEALEAIDKHPRMILRTKHFAARQINWGDKVSNLIAIAKELNLGLDSFVFLDDDLFQQNLVRESLPQVAVVPIESLKNYAGFKNLKLTEEDVRRGQMYSEERQRKELQTRLKSLDEFLQELNLKVEIAAVDDSTISRASQLTQKTNQFNLTTRRYSEEDLKKFLADGGRAWTVRAKDRFGDYGIVGVAMIMPRDSDWRIDNLLLSCRILGKGVEKELTEFVLNEAKNNGVKRLTAEYLATAKNNQVENFWDSLAFKLAEKDGDRKIYHYDL